MSKEYIERGRLISTLKDNRPLNWTNTNDEVVEQVCYDDFEAIVKNQPTADVQEVLRCIDCYWSCPWNKTLLLCKNFNMVMKPDDFCSCGEKKVKDGEQLK